MAGCPFESDACSRAVYAGADNNFIVGRSLDWKTPIPTNLYVYPRGMEKRSSDQPGALTWRSYYGAVYAVGYDGGITEGMNERGVVVNGLFCKGTVYNTPDARQGAPMSLAVFVAWMLDQCATTQEVIDQLEGTDFSIGGATFDGGTVSTLHWGITDASGHSAIVEYDNGKLSIHDMDGYPVMTNDPQWPQMRAIIDYWRKIGGAHALPGTVTSPDRCVRADFFTRHVKAVADVDEGVSITRSILATVSVPYTYLIEGEPNLSSTQWRSYAALRDGRYYFDIVTNSGIFYIDLTRLNLNEGSPVLKLDTSRTATLAGCANSHLKVSQPFTPMW